MSKKTSGMILIFVGVAMNALGQMLVGSSSLAKAGFVMLWMFASAVLVLFGLFRLIVGLVRKE